MSDPPRVPLPEADLSRVRTVPVGQRANKVNTALLAALPAADRSFDAFLASLPDLLAARDLRAAVGAIAAAARARRGVVMLLGGHVIKTGMGPLLVHLLQRGVLTHVAMNGAAAIHDFELAAYGGTSEDVAAGLKDGTFGMAEETGREMNAAIARGHAEGWGLGEALARWLEARRDAPGREHSVLLAALARGAPATVHVAIGADIIHQHPAADGAATGATTHRDFRRLAAAVAPLDGGGVVLNCGSAVIMPEVFLKALTVARNLAGGKPTGFTAVDCDMIRHYRPQLNVVERPTQAGGAGYLLTGHHEILIPLLVWGVDAALDRG
jgi:hypothetical protein